MSYITKHHAEHKWKSYYSDHAGIGFLVAWNTVSIHYFLKDYCKLICIDFCGRIFEDASSLFLIFEDLSDGCVWIYY